MSTPLSVNEASAVPDPVRGGRIAGLVFFVSGLLFAAGLGIAGMTRPAKVQAFLDFTGAWDPSLLFVMGAAIGVALVPFQKALRRQRPVLEPHFSLPTFTRIDARLVAGSALFGAGWGLSGYCPGPAVVALVTGHPGAFLFTGCMVAGLWIGERLAPHRERPGARAR